MSARFDRTADAWLTGSAGAAGAVGTGAYTMAVLYRTETGNNNFGLISLRDASAEQRGLLQDTGHLFGSGDFSSGFGNVTNNSFTLSAESKPLGSAHYRMHTWTYASDGSGTMSHGEAVGAANHGDGNTITQLRIGWSTNRGNGDIAVVAFWDSELTDLQLDTLKSNQLSAWSALNPKELVTYENWNGSTGWSTRVGSSSLSSITGTVAVGAEPSSFNYNLGSSYNPSNNQMMFFL